MRVMGVLDGFPKFTIGVGGGAAVIKCQHCLAEMDNGAIFCDFCGRELSASVQSSGQTAQPVFPNAAAAPASPEAERAPSVIVLRLATGQRFTLRGKPDYTIGRIGLGRERPDVDLAQWYGYEVGVSREHVMIHVRQEGVFIEDMGSRNETIHNNFRLMERQWYPLKDGDEIRLGGIVLTVEFQ